jgi:hypothetical protein
VQHVDPGTSGCDQLISLPNSLAKNTSRGSYYWDIIRGQPEQQRFALYRYFKDELAPFAKEQIKVTMSIFFGGRHAVPTMVIPTNL